MPPIVASSKLDGSGTTAVPAVTLMSSISTVTKKLVFILDVLVAVNVRSVDVEDASAVPEYSVNDPLLLFGGG